MTATGMEPPTAARQQHRLYALEELRQHPENRRQGDVGAIIESIRVNGFYGTVLVQASTGYLLYGNHRVRAAVEARRLIDAAQTGTWVAKDDEEQALIDSWKSWPDRFGSLDVIDGMEIDADDAMARRILIVDNRASDLASWDDAGLAADLQLILDQEGSLAGTGFTPEDLDQLLADINAEPDNEPSDASLLARTDVSIGDPVHIVERGEVWRMGPHVLCCCDVMTDWKAWVHHLTDTAIFVPYPGPYLSLTERAARQPMVMVQPDPYIAGHVLDKWCAVKGEGLVERIAT